MAHHQPRFVTSGQVGALAIGSSSLAIITLVLAAACDSAPARIAASSFTAIAALTWGSALALVGRTFARHRDDPTGAALDSVHIRRGLPAPSFAALLTLSVIAAASTFAATRNSGLPALFWGLATIVLGSFIGALRLYGFRQRFARVDHPDRPKPSFNSGNNGEPEAGADQIESWLRVSRNATTSSMARLQATQIGLFVVVAITAQLTIARIDAAVLAALVLVGLLTCLNVTTASERLRRSTSLAITLVAAAILLINLNGFAGTAQAPIGTLLAWACVLCTAAGFSTPPMRSVSSSIAIAASASIVTILLWQSRPLTTAEPAASFDWILIPAAALCVAHVTTTLTSTLGSLSRIYDDVAKRSWQDFNRATASAAHDAATFEASRLVHDTLINTLGAIRAQRIEPNRLQQRLADDLMLLDTRADHRAPAYGLELLPIEVVLHRALERARVLGVVVTYNVPDGVSEVLLDSTRRDAVFGSTLEALTNISKHSADSLATVSLHATKAGGLTLEISSHSPMTSIPSHTDGGLSRSIVERCSRANLPASITVEDDHLRITIELPGSGSEQANTTAATTSGETPFDATEYIRNATLTATRSVSFWPIGYCILLSAVWVTYYEFSWWFAGAVLSVATALTVINSRAVEMRFRWLVTATSITVALVLVWQLAGPQQFAANGLLGPLGLSYVGAAVIVVTYLFTDSASKAPNWVIVGYFIGCLICAAVLASQGNSATMPLATALGMVAFAIPLAIASQSLRTGAKRASGIAVEMSELLTWQRRLAADQLAREQLIETAIGEHRGFIDDIAQGRLPIEDPAVVAQAESVERALRNFVQVGSTPGPVSDEMLSIITFAQQAGIATEVIAFDVAAPVGPEDLDIVEQVAHWLISSASAGDTLSISTYRELDLIGITLVIDRLVPPLPSPDDRSSAKIEWIAGTEQTFVGLQFSTAAPPPKVPLDLSRS